MFARKVHVSLEAEGSERRPVPLAWLDSFAMRNFTNAAAFDDTLPIADGWLEAGYRVPLPELAVAMEAWFLRKGWLRAGEKLSLRPGDQTHVSDHG